MNEFSRVRLLTDRFRTEGVSVGSIGYVIEVYDDGNLEVEFSGQQGITIAQIVLSPGDVELAESDGMPGQGG
jgi:hypothetical protein